MLKGKFIAGRIPSHLQGVVKEGILYPLMDQNETVFLFVGECMIPFRGEQVERRGEDMPQAIIQIGFQDEFLEKFLNNFEMAEDDIDLISPPDR